ncbi:MAG TPA: quinolinate synthase NadA [Candidatus Fimicola cottocaccae]|nr:quinolinate synthase NadA [Candidatus Fimicola cottocaccae]
MDNIINEIKKLKKEKNAVILAHYYVCDEVQEIADFVGDSYYLSKKATEVSESMIVFAGVKFMGESAKILNPEKTVVMVDAKADCPMAHMVTPEKIEEVRSKYDDLAVCCYINSTAEIKAHSDVCVTSSNALKIVKSLPNKNIFFIPDGNLGRYIAEKVTDKNFIFNDGYCPVHVKITREDIINKKKEYPNAKVLIHPECTPDAVELADYAGSTAGIIDYATKSHCDEFIIATEKGVLYELRNKNPEKKFYTVNDSQICPDMKYVTLEKIKNVIKNTENVVELSEKMSEGAKKALDEMLRLAE